MAPQQTDPEAGGDPASGTDPVAPRAPLSDPDPETARRTIRAHAAAIERRELRRALNRLDARGTLTDDRRAILAALAAAIVDGVLAGPEETLAASDREADVARTAVELFDADR